MRCEYRRKNGKSRRDCEHDRAVFLVIRARSPARNPRFLSDSEPVLGQRLLAELNALGYFLDGVRALGDLVFEFNIGGEGQLVSLQIL